VTVTRWASAGRSSLGEVLIPPSTKANGVVAHQRFDAPDLGAAKAAALGSPHRIKPELDSIRIPFNVHVPRLPSVSGVKEEPIWSTPQDRRHRNDCLSTPSL
jgi:hypothetical protein